MLLELSLASALRMFQPNVRVLLSIAALGAAACGDEPNAPMHENDDSADRGGDDRSEDDADDDDDVAAPAKRDGGSVAARPEGGGSPAVSKQDASASPEADGGKDEGVDAGSSSPRDAGADASRAPSGRDSGANGGDAEAHSTAADASTGATQPPVGGSSDRTIPMSIPTPSNGAGEIRPTTTVLKSGKSGGKDVWDFENKKIGVNNPVACEGSEGQVTVFEVEDGVTVKNLIIAGGRPGGNGIVCKGSCTLDHVYWEDVCEDAATNSKDGATMILDHVVALNASDKMFQHNAKGGSKTIIRNSYVADFGKLWRSCGDCDNNGGPRHLEIDNVRVDRVRTTVAGANRNYGDTVTVKDLFVKGGYDANQDKPKICQEYIGVTNHQGESTKVNDGKSQWNTGTCKLSRSDVKAF